MGFLSRLFGSAKKEKKQTATKGFEDIFETSTESLFEASTEDVQESRTLTRGESFFEAGGRGKTGSQQLQIDEAGIQRTIQSILGGAQGLASIFAGEQTAGIFSSSVAAQAAGDLSAQIVGEIARLTGKTVTEDAEAEFTLGERKEDLAETLDQKRVQRREQKLEQERKQKVVSGSQETVRTKEFKLGFGK